MGTKFKKGDKVRVRQDLEVGKYYNMEDSSIKDIVVDRMAGLRGEVVTIRRAGAKYSIEESMYEWTDGMFEELEPKTKPIVIYQNGQSVFALDKNTGTKAEAKCSPDDTFNFYTGAQLAFERLMKTPACTTAAFEVGDFVAGLPGNRYSLTTDGWLGKVTRVHPSGRIDVYGLDDTGSMGITFSALAPEEFRLATDEEITLDWLRKVWE